MQKVVVNIENPSDVELFIEIVKRLTFVDSVHIEGEEYDWINPTRPATDKEAEKMILDAENSTSMTAEKAEKYSKKLAKKWQKKKSE
ncbi:MAG: hypothetical protein GXO86_14045 [Chlorobi bacterium]|nr:hypothetical protein [Chlorobiota bacterium]